VRVENLEKCSPAEASRRRVATRDSGSLASLLPPQSATPDVLQAGAKASAVVEISSHTERLDEEDAVTPNKRACSDDHVRRNIAVTSALVPTSTSTSIFNSTSSSLSSSSADLDHVTEIQSSHKGEAGEGVGGEAGGGEAGRGEAGGGPAADEFGDAGSSRRRPLPPSERLLSGNFWLVPFTDAVSEVTGRVEIALTP
jgi:hypothetical protein